jgi:hypothetical protein
MSIWSNKWRTKFRYGQCISVELPKPERELPQTAIFPTKSPAICGADLYCSFFSTFIL